MYESSTRGTTHLNLFCFDLRKSISKSTQNGQKHDALYILYFAKYLFYDQNKTKPMFKEDFSTEQYLKKFAYIYVFS